MVIFLYLLSHIQMQALATLNMLMLQEKPEELLLKKVGDVSCTGEAIGGYKFEDTIYGIRNNSTDAYGTIWKATGTSWAQLSYPKGN